MASKKKTFNGFSVYMVETQQEMAKKGIKMNMKDMPDYCKKKWEEMPDKKKNEYKTKSKKMKNEITVEKYTSIGEKVEDVQKHSENSKFQTNAMYSYIEELVRVNTAGYYLSKQKLIFIYINSYTCENEGFYFPAEISMAEFSLDRGLIRFFHQLIGFDKIRTRAPLAPTADINNHAKNNHQINIFSKLANNYGDILLKVIGFIINKDVDEAVLNDCTLDMPPIYTAHTSTGNELMITSASLYQLYQSTVLNACKDDFNNLFKVYHLDKLFMELKNVSYNIKFPTKSDIKALPSVAMATESLTKDMFNTIISIGCDYHEKLEHAHVCSNYHVCKWIYIFSTHCCQYYDIKLIPGCHYDFDLSKIVIPFEENIDNLKIDTKKDTFVKYDLKKTSQDKINIKSFPPLGSGSSTSNQQSIWGRSEQKFNSNSTTNSTTFNANNDFPPLGNLQNVSFQETPTDYSWRKDAIHKGISQTQKKNSDKPSGNLK